MEEAEGRGGGWVSGWRERDGDWKCMAGGALQRPARQPSLPPGAGLRTSRAGGVDRELSVTKGKVIRTDILSRLLSGC